jgi:outer membrane receptor protein involved in Fe transport
MVHHSRMWLVGLIALVVLPAVGAAQTTFATITGTITDPTGSVIPGAAVAVTHTQTGVETKAQSNEAGIYTVAQLREGTYSLKVESPGFREFVAQSLVLVARDIRRLDVTLQVGAVESAIEVTAGATLIETESARITHTKDALTLKTIPLNARWAWAFLLISPHVIQAGGVYRFAGSINNQSHWTIDGTTMADGVDGSALGPQANYIESYQELKVDLANNSAQFGAIGQMTIISKSGTNEFHGAAADYYSTPFFRARNPFAQARATGVSHLFLGAIGGPVILPKYNGKNKTFFYFDFEGSVGSNAVTFITPTVPIKPWREGDFSGLRNAAGNLTPITDPLTRQPFPGNRIPADRLNPVSKKVQERFYPLPNYGDPNVFATQNYREILTRPWDITKYMVVRGDHTFSAKDSVYGRFTFTRGANTPYEGGLPTIGQRRQRRDTRSVTGSWTHLFRSDLINEFRYGMNLNNNPIQGPLQGLEVARELGLVGLAPNLPDIGGILKVNWTGIGLQGISQVDYNNPGYRNHNEQFQEHLNWFRGKHSLKFGFDLNRVEFDDLLADPSLFGNLTFSTQFTGHPYADFLLGLPTTLSRGFPPIRVDRNRWQYDFFVTDAWKVTPKLTLDIGLRYELHLPWRENNNRIAMFDTGSGSIVVPDGSLGKISPSFPDGYVGLIEASKAGLPARTLVRSDRNNLAPRFGIAWRPWGSDTVFRGGWGMFYDIVPREASAGSVPYVLREPAYTNPKDNPIVLPRVFPDTGPGKLSTVSLPTAVNPEMRIPYSMQYNFAIEHRRWDTGFRLYFITTTLRAGEYAYNYNSPVPDTRLFIDKPRPFPDYPAISYLTNGAGHTYRGLSFEAQRSLARGLYFQGAWTWARDILDVRRGRTIENPFDRAREVGPAQEIPTHRMSANWIYQLPFGQGRRYLSGRSRGLNLVVGGWELTGIYTTQTGQFLTPTWSGPDPTGTAYTTSRTPAQVTIRPDILHNPNLPPGERGVTRWFDTTAFAAPPAMGGRFGTSANGVIIGPGVNVWNLGLIKDFYFGEKAPRLRYEVSATNAFNHPNWNSPRVNVSAPNTFGTIAGVGGVNDTSGARVFRMGLRLEF